MDTKERIKRRMRKSGLSEAVICESLMMYLKRGTTMRILNSILGGMTKARDAMWKAHMVDLVKETRKEVERSMPDAPDAFLWAATFNVCTSKVEIWAKKNSEKRAFGLVFLNRVLEQGFDPETQATILNIIRLKD